LTGQKEINVESPEMDDLYSIGTVARIRQIVKMPGQRTRVIAEGLKRGRLCELIQEETYASANVEVLVPVVQEMTAEVEVLMRTAREYFQRYVESGGKVTRDRVDNIMRLEDPGELADIMAANVVTKMEDRQEILEIMNPCERLERVCALMLTETEMVGIEREVQQRVREQIYTFNAAAGKGAAVNIYG
jgi:ATP-dependent Lon protease